MSARAAEVQTGPVTGFRLWRVLPYQPLDGPPSVRLCAFGTNGTPKVWSPREPVRAVCSAFDSTHDAPSVSHGCGLWALRTRDMALKQLARFLKLSNVENVYGWAIGEVALWGRVIEHEQGWRAQYAYPLTAEVVCRRPYSASAVADTYGIPVEWTRRTRKQRAGESSGASIETRLEEVFGELDALKQSLLAWDKGGERGESGGESEPAAWVVRSAAQLDADRRAFSKLPAIETDDPITLDEVLIGSAMVDAAEGPIADRCYGIGGPQDITEKVLERRGYEGPFVTRSGYDIRGGAVRSSPRPGLLSARAKTIRTLDHAVDGGLMEVGRPYHVSSGRRWFLTAAGIARVQVLLAELPLLVVERETWGVFKDGKQCVTAIDVRGHACDIRPRDPDEWPFEDEVEETRERWTIERRAAIRAGRSVYRAWLAERRALPVAAIALRYSDAEIVRALNAATRRHRGAVPFKNVMQELAPGEALRGETAAATYRLEHIAGVKRERVGSTLFWQAGAPTRPKAKSRVL